MVVLTILAATLAVPFAPPLIAKARVELNTDVVHLGDVVDLAALPLAVRRAAMQRVVARMPAGHRSMTISRAGLSLLVRRAVPNFAPTPGGTMPIILALRSTYRQAEREECAVSVGVVAAGTALTPDMVSRTACRNERAAAVTFDQDAGITLARRDLAVGDYLGRVILAKAPGVRKGAQVRLISSAGPVRVERLVTAMQDGRGRRLFVRDEDGQIFSTRLALPVPENGQ